MDLQLRNKTALITGSTSGIGFNTAKVFLKEGARVCVTGKSEATVSRALSLLRKEYPNADIEGLEVDFSEKKSVSRFIKNLPELDILVNNVGIYRSQSFFDTSDEDWYHQYEVNVMSGVRLARSVFPLLLEKNWGRILFVSSECAALVPPDLISYSVTKAAMLAVSRGLAQLTKGSGLTVNAVLPGSTMTEGAQEFISNLAQEERKTIAEAESDFFSEHRSASLLHRFATVDEIAKTIVYLSSPLSAATNGAAIKLEGGSTGGII